VSPRINDGRTSISQQLAAALRLSWVPGVGPRLRAALLARFESAENVLRASVGELQRVPGIGARLASAIALASARIDVEEELHTCRAHGIEVVTEEDERFPAQLRHIVDPPFALFCRGTLEASDNLAIAIVGTRHATVYGKRTAHQLAGGLARAGFTIVSGMARGIDAAAHRGALDAGGRTLGMLAGGLLNIYPAEHRELALDIGQSGALLSEFPCRWPIKRGAFPRRNRLITGLSLGVIVVEAGTRSGALTSAHHALVQGRDVFAVPGPVTSRVSHGCHALLRDGATLVESADDVIAALGPLAQTASDVAGRPIRHPGELRLTEQEQRVLHSIETQPTRIDHIVSACGLPVARVLSTISVLEMRKLVLRVSGQLVCRL
jgi:DNA processing protein